MSSVQAEIAGLPSELRVADCTFCDIGAGKERSLFDRAQWLGDGSTYLVPTVGMMIPGYFLAVTKQHLTSYAQLDPATLTEVDDTLNKTEFLLSRRLADSRYFRLEHGSDNLEACGSGGCIDHAHTHLIPADEDVGAYVQDLLPWQQLDGYEDLADFRGVPYAYLGRLGMHYAIANPKLPGQWIRRQIAHIRGADVLKWYGQRAHDDAIGDDADWALHPGIGSLRHTMTMLRAVPRGLPILRRDDPAFFPSDNYVRPRGTSDWAYLLPWEEVS